MPVFLISTRSKTTTKYSVFLRQQIRATSKRHIISWPSSITPTKMLGKLKKGSKTLLMHMVFWEMKESKETMMVQDRALSSMLSKTLVALDTDKTQVINNTTKVEIPSLAANSTAINMVMSIINRQATVRLMKIPDKKENKKNKLTKTLKNFSEEIMKILIGKEQSMRR